jgi:predicted outer membrane lipoprotein
MSFEIFCMSMIALLVGLIIAFNGYRLFLVLLPIWGFFFGFGLGAQTIQALFGGGFLATTTSWVVGFVVALVFAVLSYLFYMVAVALFAGSIGYALGVGLMGLIGFQMGFVAWIVGIILAVIVAGVVILFNIQKWVIILLTALGGAGVIIGTFLMVFGVV